MFNIKILMLISPGIQELPGWLADDDHFQNLLTEADKQVNKP